MREPLFQHRHLLDQLARPQALGAKSGLFHRFKGQSDGGLIDFLKFDGVIDPQIFGHIQLGNREYFEICQQKNAQSRFFESDSFF